MARIPDTRGLAPDSLEGWLLPCRAGLLPGQASAGAQGGRARRRLAAGLAVALAAAALSAWALCWAGVGPRALLPLYLAGVSLPLCAWDLAHRRLPNALVLPGYAVAAVGILGLRLAGEPAAPALAAGAGTFGFFLLLALAGGMGMGDVKLAGLIGLASGALAPGAALLAVVIAFLTGGVAGIAAWLVPELRTRGIPFGPYLLLGLWAAPAFA
ncbi:MAG TPA: A24 family peptidase [Microbacteriaceae bacterium]|nr:A24 family peptidase [Microbacteriaceae bacterium]